MKEKFDTFCLYGLCVEYPRNWRTIIDSKQLQFKEGKVNAIGDDILMGILWEKVKKNITLEDYEEMVLANLKKKDKEFNLIRKETIEVSDHRAFKETIETRGRSGLIGLRKKPIEHIHVIFYCRESKRFITVYVTVLPKLKSEYAGIIKHIFDSVHCIH